MRKLIILTIGLVLLAGLAVFVGGDMINKGGKVYEVNIYLYEGWNIIAGTIPKEGILANSEIKETDIAAVWYYSPLQKKYIRVHPNADWDSLGKDDDDFVLTSAMWIYSKKQGTIRYSTLEDYLPLNKRKLYSGWNFVTITSEFIGKSLNDIKGDCDITKAYLWDTKNQQWGTIFNLLDDKNILRNEGGEGGGVVIKVSNDCTLGSTVNISQPPTLPE